MTKPRFFLSRFLCHTGFFFGLSLDLLYVRTTIISTYQYCFCVAFQRDVYLVRNSSISFLVGPPWQAARWLVLAVPPRVGGGYMPQTAYQVFRARAAQQYSVAQPAPAPAPAPTPSVSLRLFFLFCSRNVFILFSWLFFYFSSLSVVEGVEWSYGGW